MNTKRKSTQRWYQAFGLRIMSIIEKAKADARYLNVDYGVSEKIKISNRDGLRWTVNLMKRECPYRKWQLTRIPCAYAISSIVIKEHWHV